MLSGSARLRKRSTPNNASAVTGGGFAAGQPVKIAEAADGRESVWRVKDVRIRIVESPDSRTSGLRSGSSRYSYNRSRCYVD